jgi:uncharacterized protein (TIGR02646 family)
MKRIDKGEEPAGFSGWKAKASSDWRPTWDGLSNPQKDELKRSLLLEQGHICCYCGIRIALVDSHIEHIKPRRKYGELALDYSNMLASCEGSTEDGASKQQHCGHKKSDWFNDALTVSPLDPQCESLFAYTSAGEVRPVAEAHPKAAQETIRHLALNVSSLVRARKTVLDGVLADIDSLNSAEIGRLVGAFKTRNGDGAFVPFCMAIVDVLSRYL